MISKLVMRSIIAIIALVLTYVCSQLAIYKLVPTTGAVLLFMESYIKKECSIFKINFNIFNLKLLFIFSKMELMKYNKD